MVKSGSIDIVDDDQKLVRTIHQGGHFGERALMEDRHWRYNALAREPSTLVSLGEHVFRQLIAGCGDISELLTQTAATYASAEEIDQVMERIPKAVRSRIATELMSSTMCSLRHDQTISNALDLLQSEPHSTYPVLNDDGSALGVLRRGQLYDLLKGDDVSMNTALSKILLSHPPEVTPGMAADEVLEKLIRSSKTKALVIDENQKLVGIISLFDLLEAKPERTDLI
jgi:NADH dehydrogenase